MKQCTKCGKLLEDDSKFCYGCGAKLDAPQPAAQPAAQPAYQPQPAAQPAYQPQPAYQAQYNYAAAAPAVDPYDHTSEFTKEDISSNKVISMLVYLMGFVGIIIALLASNTSKFAAYHVRQALKFTVVEILMAIILVVGAIINIIPFLGWFIYILALLAYVGLSGTFFVLKIICFFQICKGKAKEPVIIRSLGFLR